MNLAIAIAVRLGGGFIDCAAFSRGLRDGGFDGIAVFERCSPLRGGGSPENPDAGAEACLKWMERRAGEQ